MRLATCTTCFPAMPCSTSAQMMSHTILLRMSSTSRPGACFHNLLMDRRRDGSKDNQRFVSLNVGGVMHTLALHPAPFNTTRQIAAFSIGHNNERIPFEIPPNVFWRGTVLGAINAIHLRSSATICFFITLAVVYRRQHVASAGSY